MTSVCPFTRASRPDDASGKKTSENQNKQQSVNDNKPQQDSAISAKCPFSGASLPEDASGKKTSEPQDKQQAVNDNKPQQDSVIPAKCPYGYDSQTFKVGPLSCVICQALLFQCSKCVPCSHVYCKACISRFNDCPICGADIEKIEDDLNLQSVVDRFIEGHARIKRSQVDTGKEEKEGDKKTVIYEDVSLERGAFLMQHAMRALRANNIESAKSRLSLCAEDVREQLERMGNTPELCSRLGAVLGMLGDCCRATGDASSAISCFEDSVNFLMKVPRDDMEIIHTLSVSLNKIGDLKYYEGDLHAARSYYFQALDVRRCAINSNSSVPSQVIDVAVSLAKVADVDRNMGNEDAAITEFQEAIKLLESLTISAEEAGLEQRRLSVLEFLNTQLGKK